MKLLINRADIIDAFVAKTGFEASDIEIEMTLYPLPAPLPADGRTRPHLSNPDVRFAIASIFDEGELSAHGKANRISLIKAIRTLSNGTTVGEAGEFVDKVLICSDGGKVLIRSDGGSF